MSIWRCDQARLRGSTADGAPAEDLQGVPDLGEAVLGGLLLGPLLHGRHLDLDRSAERSAHQAAMVARYHRSTAPPSVHVVALLQYVGGLVALLAAGAVAVLTFAGRQAFDDRRIQIPAEVEQGLTGAGAIIAGALAVVALLWLVI